MRKFLLRWWYTPNWEQDCYGRMIKAWHTNPAQVVADAMRKQLIDSGDLGSDLFEPLARHSGQAPG